MDPRIIRVLDATKGATSATVRVHRAVPERFLTEHEGMRVVTPAAACMQVAAVFGAEAGLVSADDALRRGLMTTSDLGAALSGLGVSRMSRGPSQMVALADARIESAAESRARGACHLAGLGQRTPQVELRDEWGSVWPRFDFLIEDLGIVIEVVRLIWADLGDPRVVRRKAEAAITRARRRSSA